MFVLWDWVWVEDEEDVDRDASEKSDDEEECNDTDNEDDYGSDKEDDNEESHDGIPTITHSIIFKCIGCTKEHCYQAVLIKANEKHRKEESVPVKLEREPNNPYDCNSIAFMCKVEDKWERIGYVVTEALSDVSNSMRDKKIVKVYFSWIKFKYFRPPGWYTGITVTKNSSWSTTVVQNGSRN